MLILNEQQIQSFYGMEDAIRDVTRILQSKHQNKIETPFRTVIEFPEKEASVLYMPGADIKQEYATNKVVSIFPQNSKDALPTTQGVTLLTSAQNGKHLALMNASYLTRLRTGAITAIATDFLARKDAAVLAMIGTGGMALEQIIGVLAVREVKRVYLYNPTQKKAILLKEKLEKMYVDVVFEVTDSVEEAAMHADIINCATRSLEKVLNAESVAKGTHINGIGSYLPHMREIDPALIIKENKVVVDDMHGVMEEAGEFIFANETGNWSFDDIHSTLEQLVVHEKKDRAYEEEITIFKSVGAAYYDLAVAIGVYEKALQKGDIGIVVEI
jgi:ornithine cyclodeaminase/alanine dehydrogenase-like protein (mu-crystallin family)